MPLGKTLAMILAGGEGRRLAPLTQERSKPAVTFGGRYRIIDFVLSNFANSGVLRMKVLTQYKSESLNTHISRGWRLSSMLGQFVESVPAQQRTGPEWYKGSADAIYQNLNLVTDEEPDYVFVFGADHIYRMDVRQMLDFHVAQKADCTVHAGEAYGPPSIAQALHYCGAHRIGHGVRLREDGDLLNYVNDHRIPIECCPSSNVQTGAVADMATHPFKFYLDFGIRVTINTDNRLITETTVTKELSIVSRQFGLTASDIRNILVAGFKSAFLTFHDRAQLVRKAQNEMDEIIGEFAQRNGAPKAIPAKPATSKPPAVKRA